MASFPFLFCQTGHDCCNSCIDAGQLHNAAFYSIVFIATRSIIREGIIEVPSNVVSRHLHVFFWKLRWYVTHGLCASLSQTNYIPLNERQDTSTSFLHCQMLTTPSFLPPLKSLSFVLSVCFAFGFTDASKLELCWDNRLSYPRYWKFLCHSRHFLALSQSTGAWFTSPFRILFDCRTRSILAISSWAGNSLVRCTFPASCSTIFCCPCSLFELEGVHWVWE